MNRKDFTQKSITIDAEVEIENHDAESKHSKKRILIITAYAIFISALISVIAAFLMKFIHLITNLCFYGVFSFSSSSPSYNHLGYWVILIPAIGGLIVGLMILFGSKDIRGHGIPEAMEQILTNNSKINPVITYLKPIASAFAIGSGGPFGAEGPIIATGGALGSTLGQITKISHNERKILLAAGSAAGMAAIFGTPIASIFLAIELLLFEFSPRSIIPVALACVVGAAGHHIFFGTRPFFEMPELGIPGSEALFLYCILGLIIGVISVGVSKFVYVTEDWFKKIPIHYMWYPAIGGLVVGLIGYYAPKTLGVGYDNITDLLLGKLPIGIILGLCVMKFLSWSIALGSGTAGGTLAPLFIIGGATGSLLGMGIMQIFPDSGVTLQMSALLGMAAMFAGSSRAVLTSIIFAVETTGQANGLLPLLGACLTAYLISFILMKNTIMTEKIARRGVDVPDSFEFDVLSNQKVGQFIKSDGFVISEDSSVKDARLWLFSHPIYKSNFFIVTTEDGKYVGILSSSTLYGEHLDENNSIKELVKRKNIYISKYDNLRTAVKMMATENIDVLPVIEFKEGAKHVVGVLGYQDIISSYKNELEENIAQAPTISIKQLHVLRKGMNLWQRK